MEPTETQNFDSEISLRNWLVSLIFEKEEENNSPIGYFQFEITSKDEKILLKAALVFDKLLAESGGELKPTFGIYFADSVIVAEQAMKDFRGRWSSCRAEMPNHSSHNVPLDIDSEQSAIKSEFITYSTPCFLEKTQSAIFNA